MKRGGMKLGADFLEHWLPRLEAKALQVYLALGRLLPEMRHFEAEKVDALLENGGSTANAVKELERVGLLERVDMDGKSYLHFRHKDRDGWHRAEPVAPSLAEALEFLDQMTEEILAVDSEDETEQLRRRVFDAHPELEDEYRLYLETRDDDSPRWRLWMELSVYLMTRFEERYGELRADHEHLFRERQGKLLRVRIEMQDRLTNELLERRDEIFPESGDGWLVSPGEAIVSHLSFVQDVARRGGMGVRQVYLNLIEALQQEGWVICELSERRNLVGLLLPTTTGLSDEEAHLAFSSRKELIGEGREPSSFEEPRAEAREAYREHLVQRGLETLLTFEEKERIADRDRLLRLIARRVNESLAGLPHEGDPPRVEVGELSERYRAMRAS